MPLERILKENCMKSRRSWSWGYQNKKRLKQKKHPNYYSDLKKLIFDSYYKFGCFLFDALKG